MKIPPPSLGSACTFLVAWWAATGGLLPAEETPAPPDLHDVATGEAVPAAETTRTRDFGAVVQGVGTRGQLKVGDLILAVDGWRIHDFREYEVARNKQPTEPRMVLLVNRRGILETLKLTDLPPGRNLGVDFDTAVEQNSFSDVVETCGLPLDAPTRDALPSVSRHAAAALEAWRHDAGAQPDTAWLQDFLKSISPSNSAVIPTPRPRPTSHPSLSCNGSPSFTSPLPTKTKPVNCCPRIGRNMEKVRNSSSSSDRCRRSSRLPWAT